MSECAFVDMNSFFASVEQQERKELRGRPIIVAPLLADSTCAIAASYEARAWGIKTGTPVRKAKMICPELEVVEARPKVYMEYHGRIVETLEGLFTGVKVLSVDEMACEVGRLQRGKEEALGQEIKRRFRVSLGEMMRCSVGIAPNVFLAKVASEMEKPDGFTMLRGEDLPGRLFDLHLLDLPGIGMNMATRLERHGIRTVRQLWECSPAELRAAWGSVVGERWWYMLRGSREADYGAYLPEVRKSVGHSHVLPPEFRTNTGAKAILMRLFSKCLKRLRQYGQMAGSVQVQAVYAPNPPAPFPNTLVPRREGGDVSVSQRSEISNAFATFRGKRERPCSWRKVSRKHLPANDELTWVKIVRPLVEALPEAREGFQLKQVMITFGDLILSRDVNLSLFEDGEVKARLSETMDRLNGKEGNKLDVASVYWLRGEAPERIAFGKMA